MEELLTVRRYDTAVAALRKFCKENTEFQVVIHDEDYPFRVEFLPDPQLSMFPELNVDEAGEVRTMTIETGLSTKVQSRLNFTVEAAILKKLIRLVESVGFYYYQAFRQQMAAKMKGASHEKE